MIRSSTTRLVAAQPLGASSSTLVRRLPWVTTTRCLSQTHQRRQEDDSSSSFKPKSRALLENLYGARQAPSGQSQSQSQSQEKNSMASLSQSSVFKAMNQSGVDTSSLMGGSTSSSGAASARSKEDLEPYHLHIYSHKHNTHVTCTKPNREPIISLSAGNLGYRKSRRGTYDSAYSLTKYLIERLIHNGWPMKMKRLEVVLRGFGQGREAALKVIMSPEGKVLRDKIVRVAESTRLKFGGTRSKAPRRL
ncbi:small subunit ribosomal protein S11 [Geosmithia morbida]|uniref:Small subunit ribosomal protein S11 n=1 Tax=Geosmithia morbida TaxID=1094350 RepID=A0A9P5D399_9HYPO|nr:small subunit ribosomal protein S11 [Geosmithia morbida]KAF4122326.1 small subunit ribosomal protein S11 [Geosmithia morbida]